MLGRLPSTPEIASGVGTLAQGGTLAGLRSTLANGQDFTNNVNALYRSVLGRDAQAPELAWFQGQAEQGKAMPAVLAGFRANLAKSQEAANSINAAFNAHIGRDASTSEISFYQGTLTGEASISQVSQNVDQAYSALKEMEAIHQLPAGVAAFVGSPGFLIQADSVPIAATFQDGVDEASGSLLPAELGTIGGILG